MSLSFILSALGLAILSIIIIIIFNLWNNLRKVKHLPGTFQIAFSHWRIPLISPILYTGNGSTIGHYSKLYGDSETRLFRIAQANKNVVSISDADHMKDILIKFGDQVKKPEFIYQMVSLHSPNLLSAANNEIWKKHHKVVQSAFSPENLKYVAQVATRSVDLMMQQEWKLNDSNAKEIRIEPKTHLIRLTLDILGKAALGYNFGVYDGHESVGIQKLNQESSSKPQKENHNNNRDGYQPYFTFEQVLQETIHKLFLMKRFVSEANIHIPLKLLGYFTGQKDEYIMSDIDYYVRSIIKERYQEVQNNQEKSHDILSLLIDANEKESKEDQLSYDTIISNALVFILAGHETSSLSIQWLLYELGRHPEVQDKMIQEIDEKLPNRQEPQVEDFDELECVKGAINENLRLHPPAPQIMRQATKSIKLKNGSFTIPKNTLLQLNIEQVHYNEKYWENPHEFRIDRWLNGNKPSHLCAFIPFSYGNRTCIGYKFATYEIFTFIIRFLQFYRVASVEHPEKVTSRYEITQHPSNLIINIRKREA